MENEGSNPPAPSTAASTQDVLGQAVGETNVDPKWSVHYRLLVEQRETILKRRRDLVSQAAEEITPVQRNLAERGTEIGVTKLIGAWRLYDLSALALSVVRGRWVFRV